MSNVFNKKIYNSAKWRKVRDAYMSEKNYICERCGLLAEEVHHKTYLTPANINNPEIVFGKDNLEALCKNCHFAEHREQNLFERSQNKFVPILDKNKCYFDDNGEYQETRVYVVHGCIGAGKTTYVREHMQKGDLVVDLDYIKQALSIAQHRDDVGDNYIQIALSVKEYLLQQIEKRNYDSKNVFVIGILPNKKERQQLIKRLKAQEIHINKSRNECVENIMYDDSRKDKDKYVKWIDNYFIKYES